MSFHYKFKKSKPGLFMSLSIPRLKINRNCIHEGFAYLHDQDARLEPCKSFDYPLLSTSTRNSTLQFTRPLCNTKIRQSHISVHLEFASHLHSLDEFSPLFARDSTLLPPLHSCGTRFKRGIIIIRRRKKIRLIIIII